jgi:hypothetical protein
MAKFAEIVKSEVELRRIPIPRTLVNKARRRTGLIWAPALPLARIIHEAGFR